MAISNAEAGPSKPSKTPEKRVATFLSDSDGSDGETELVPRRTVKGKAATKATNGSEGKPADQKKRKTSEDGSVARQKKRIGAASGKDEGAGARRKEAERLFEARQQLPFYQGRRTILEEIMSHDTTIIIGETGCGKSTQLPQLLRRHALSIEHFGRAPRIACTQPRRLPAIGLAQRVSAEMGTALGDEVGYTVRFEDATSARTGIRYLTEGVLMRELASSRREQNGADGPAADDGKEAGLDLLLKYDIVIVDEAHERTLNTDFICGALKKIQRVRKQLSQANREQERDGESSSSTTKTRDARPLKIVVMSATLDPSKFTRFFETGRDALIVKGRMFPVGTRHAVEPVDDFIEAAAKQALSIHCSPNAAGDILIFMPGSDEIESCAEVLRRASKDLSEAKAKIAVLPLYASLPPAAQAKIFVPAPEGSRRVIIATNIAETSITIPGVSYVIDSGFKKEKEYIFRQSGAIEHLKKKHISKAAAWQRTGRAGREREGECYRLYTKGAFDALAEFDAPEIQRCNLASAVLQLVAMGQDPFAFEYIDSPGREPILAAFQTLAGLSALSSPTSLTPLGRSMLSYPLDPTHARILLASFDLACPSEIIDILSLVNAGPLWIDRSNEREEIAKARTKFLHRDGDHLTGLNAFRGHMAIREEGHAGGAGGGVAQWCKENYVNSKTLAHALKIREQLRELAVREGRDPDVSCGSDFDRVGKSLLQGLFMNSAIITADGTYRQTAGNLQVKIHPSSVLMSKKVPAILYDELAITTSIYARNVSAFEQQWLTEIPWFRQAGQNAPQPALASARI